ncbi:hypothetical protein SDC9_191081 [bioreactor metagenome]|uniref:Uncharacterized protein n=1 Tax=bioreactor metagenome TaxID=1076179 RepID=A0A645HWV0_9ZZZZ
MGKITRFMHLSGFLIGNFSRSFAVYERLKAVLFALGVDKGKNISFSLPQRRLFFERDGGGVKVRIVNP